MQLTTFVGANISPLVFSNHNLSKLTTPLSQLLYRSPNGGQLRGLHCIAHTKWCYKLEACIFAGIYATDYSIYKFPCDEVYKHLSTGSSMTRSHDMQPPSAHPHHSGKQNALIHFFLLLIYPTFEWANFPHKSFK